MFWPLKHLFQCVVRDGRLSVRDTAGKAWTFGDSSGSVVRIALSSRALEWRLAFQPELAAAEGYMSGRLRIDGDDPYPFIELMARNLKARPLPGWSRALSALKKAFSPGGNGIAQARRQIAHHYDLDVDFYGLFLDPDLHYSCAYFRGPTTLETAQADKLQHIAAKLQIGQHDRVLDIGSGWGGLALYLATVFNAKVTGVTLSKSQLTTARSRAKLRGLDGLIDFALQDYRDVERQYTKVVSVGMFEHVGRGNYATFFRQIHRVLEENGVGLVHTIGRSDAPSSTNPFIAKYIFPGGYLPSLSEICRAAERSGLIISDVEVLRTHYALTLQEWRSRFRRNRKAAVTLRGEQFCRMWEFYLAAAEAGFRHQNLVVFQIQLVKSIDVLPITRDYIHATEQRLRVPALAHAAE